jgi:FeS assembly SUF system protein
MSGADDYKYPNSLKSLDVVQPTAKPAESVKVEDATSAKPQAGAAVQLSDIERKLLEGRVIAAMRTVYDPEIPVNIYDLGLIYDIDVRPDGYVHVKMTLTAPGCPVAGSLPMEVQRKVQGAEGVTDAEVVLVWDPPWDKSRMSEEAQLALGF